MELPQEIEVWYTIPAVRRALAQELVKMGLTQRAVAQRLDVTEAAISQYLKNKRGTEFAYEKPIQEAILASAKRVAKVADQSVVRDEINRLCDLMKKHKVICELHKKYDKSKAGCTTCYD